MGTRSSTASGTRLASGARPAASVVSTDTAHLLGDLGRLGKPERAAQGRALLVLGAVHAAVLQLGDDPLDELVEPVGRRRADDDEPVGGPLLHVAVELGG